MEAMLMVGLWTPHAGFTQTELMEAMLMVGLWTPHAGFTQTSSSMQLA